MPAIRLAGSELIRQVAAAGLAAVPEAFADRAYSPEGRLVSRRLPGAVLHDATAIAARCVQMLTDGTVRAIDGSVVDVAARSICVHGDTPGAVAIAQQVQRSLVDAGIALQPFAGR